MIALHETFLVMTLGFAVLIIRLNITSKGEIIFEVRETLQFCPTLPHTNLIFAPDYVYLDLDTLQSVDSEMNRLKPSKTTK